MFFSILSYIIFNKDFNTKTINTPGTPNNPTIADVIHVIGMPRPNRFSTQIMIAPIKEFIKNPITFTDTLKTTLSRNTTKTTANTNEIIESSPQISPLYNYILYIFNLPIYWFFAILNNNFISF